MKGVVCLIFASVFAAVNGTKLPAYITPCSQSLPSDKLSLCILTQARKTQPFFAKGIPEFNVDPIDPLSLPNINAATGTFKIKSRNVILKGLRKVDIKDMKINLQENEGEMILFGNLSFSSDYQTEGNVLLIPITGKGKLSVKMYDTELKMKFRLWKVIGKDGAEHLQTHNKMYSQKYGNCKIHLTNLLGGAEIGDTVNQVLNDNWMEIIGEVGDPFIKAVIARVHDIINEFYNKISFEEMTLP